MSSDPRRGLIAALVIAGLCAAWFAVSILYDASLAAAWGMNRHAITYMVIVIATMALATALVFARFAAVREELLAGRRVFGRWTVDPSTWSAITSAALEADALEKRSVLLAVLVLIALVFGGFALFDPWAAPGMFVFGCVVAVAVAVAALLGERTRRAHGRFRGGEVIVGERGLLANDVLHVWALPLSRLLGARLVARPSALVVGYGWFSRVGLQEVELVLPVPASARAIAAEVADALTASIGGPTRRSGPKRAPTGSAATPPKPLDHQRRLLPRGEAP